MQLPVKISYQGLEKSDQIDNLVFDYSARLERFCDHINPAPVRISLLVRVICLFDGHIAAVDVVAKFLEPCGVIQNEIVDLVRFFQTPIRDLNRQLHD